MYVVFNIKVTFISSERNCKLGLAFWKHKLLIKPRRLAFVTSVFSSIPTYYMLVS